MRLHRRAVAAALAVACGAALPAESAPPANAASPPVVALARLDCGTIHANQLNAFSDTQDYDGQSRELTDSCYLVRHGDAYLLFDTGLPLDQRGKANDRTQPIDASLQVSLTDQLATLKVAPSAIRYVALSHYHFDHAGQAAQFPGATLLIGAADWAAVNAPKPPFGFSPALLAPWLTGGAKVEPVAGDRDVFGDGTVTLLTLPGHTPGHQGMLVRLRGRNILVTGDAAHFRENYDHDGVPTFNTDRAQTLASLDRARRLAASQHATVVMGHEPSDIAKLAPFPAWTQ